MKFRIDRLLLMAILLVGVGQLTFTIVVDPHVRCSTTPEIASALANEGLPAKEQCLSDATAYHLLAAELSDTGRYERPFDRILLREHRPTAEYPPLFPFALSLVHRAGINSVDGAQAVIGTLNAMLTALAVCLIARTVGLGRWLQATAILIVGFQPLLLQAHALLMTDSMFLMIATFVALLAINAARRPGFMSAARLGIALGAAALTRGEGLLWIPILATFLGIAIARPFSVARRIAIGAAVLVFAGAVLLPWTARNAARFDALVPVSNNLGTVLDGANCELTYYGQGIGSWRSTFSAGAIDRTTDCFEGFHIEDNDFNEIRATTEARRAGTNYAKSHARRLPVVGAARVARTFGAFNPGQQINLEVLEGRDHLWQTVGTALWWITMPLAMAGLALMFRRDMTLSLMLAVPWVAVVITSVATYGNQRFRIGLDAVAIVLGLLAVHELTQTPSAIEHTASPADS